LLLVWGFTVVGDSPQYSALAAAATPPNLVGSALTMMNSIGFALTIPSIELAQFLLDRNGSQWFLVPMAIGPVIGLWFMRRFFNVRRTE
jgi:DHA1 family inner membrane transport protein